ncbi:MAG: hypothetical protein HKN29_14155, partial [Rhodothermales bacterium]|nr:hypothetical protein [Rhodothermales bacterium]
MRAQACLVVAALVALGSVQAQDSTVRMEWLSVQDGLPGTGITDIVQDPAGYLWFATFFGVARYDGLRFEYFRGDPFDPNALPHSTILDLFDAGTHLWVATETDGLFRFDYAQEEFAPVETPEAIFEGLTTVHEQGDGTLLLGTWMGGMYRRDPSGKWSHFQHDPADPATLTSNYVSAFKEDSSGRLWVSSGNGLNLFDADAGTFRQFLVVEDEPRTPEFRPTDFPNYPSAASLALVEAPDETLWVGTGNGLVHLDREGAVLRRIGTGDGLPESWVHALFLAESGKLWVGTIGGPVLVDLATYRVSPLDLGAHPGARRLDRFVLSMHLDHSGVLWLGTAGAVAHVRTASDSFDIISLPFMTAMGILEDASGRLWVGSTEGTVGVWQPGTGQFEVIAPPAFSRTGALILRDIVIDSQGRMNVATMGQGVFRFRMPAANSTELRFLDRISRQDGLSDDVVYALTADEDGTLWVANQTGLDRVSPDGTVHSMVSNPEARDRSVPPGPIIDVERDRNGALWVTSLEGVARSEDQGQTFTRYPHIPNDRTSVSHPYTYTLTPSDDGSVWVTTYSALDRWDPDTGAFSHVVLDPELPLTSTTCALAGRHIWASTFSGIGRIDRSGRLVHYGLEHGLSAVDFANGTACHRGPSGRLYFSGRNKLYTVDPATFRDNLTPPKTAVSRVSLGEQTYLAGQWPGAHRRLAHSENDLTFHFAGFHYEEPARLTFTYRLLEQGSRWIDLGTTRSVRLSLQPGAYTLEVRSRSAMGVYSAPAATRFLIRRPWWGMPAVWLGLFVLVGVALGAGYRARVRGLAKRSRMLRRVVRDRTAELRAEKDRSESQAKRLVELDRAKSHFFANVSHEFRTPLTLILGPLQDLLDGRRTASDLRRDAPIMQRSALRLLRLINQILDLSRLEAGTLQVRAAPTDLVAFLRGLVLSFASYAEREHISLMFQASVERCPVMMDRDKLEKVVSNLVTNAVSFTPARGKVLVQLELADNCTEGAIHVSDT